MPKSRNRRRKSPKGKRPSDRPYRSIASQLTPAHERAVCESADAELRGDAATRAAAPPLGAVLPAVDPR